MENPVISLFSGVMSFWGAHFLKVFRAWELFFPPSTSADTLATDKYATFQVSIAALLIELIEDFNRTCFVCRGNGTLKGITVKHNMDNN